jgi:hypothetical protein
MPHSILQNLKEGSADDYKKSGALSWQFDVINLAQGGFRWHVFVNGDGHSSSAIVWNVCVG